MKRSGMRRGRGAGNNISHNMQSRQNVFLPRVTEPSMLEYISNIDVELNELKRRREILEHQHGYSQSQRGQSRHDEQREFLYDAPRYYEQLYDGPEEYHLPRSNTHSYEVPAQSDAYVPLNSGRKRPNPWQDDSMPKRFFGFEGNNTEKSFGSHLSPKPNPRHVIQPVKFNQNLSRHKKFVPPKRSGVNYQKPKPLMSLNPQGSLSSTRAGFKSKNKVSKANVAPARSNNMKAYPTATRKALVGEALQADASVDESLVLHADCKPSRKMRGRLELALGHILKSIKDQITLNLKDDHMSPSQNMKRLVKQIIRERIKNLMLGKCVGPHMEIVEAYRAQFPPETDQNMLKAAQETVKSNFKYNKAGSPVEFLQLNLGRVLSRKLNEMFGKLEEIYSVTRGPLKVTNVENKAEETCENNDSANNVSATTGECNVTDNAIPDNKTEPGPTGPTNNQTFTLEEFNSVLEQKLLYMLKKFVPHLTQIMKLDYTYESKVAEVIIKANIKGYTLNNKSERIASNGGDTVSEDNGGKSTSTAGEKQSTAPMKHYIRVIGNPVLPKRKVMQAFLDQFDPKSIKKHKKKHNLLVVGFTEKKNFDDIIAKSGVTIGKSVIEIKASEPARHKAIQNINIDTDNINDTDNENNKTADTESYKTTDSDNIKPTDTSEHNTSCDSDSKIISPGLDQQINDLLTSIRQSEEENGSNITQPATEDTNQISETKDGNNKVTTIVETDDEKKRDESIETDISNSEMQTETLDVKVEEKMTVSVEEINVKTEKNTEKIEDPVVAEISSDINTIEENNKVLVEESATNENNTNKV